MKDLLMMQRCVVIGFFGVVLSFSSLLMVEHKHYEVIFVITHHSSFHLPS